MMDEIFQYLTETYISWVHPLGSSYEHRLFSRMRPIFESETSFCRCSTLASNPVLFISEDTTGHSSDIVCHEINMNMQCVRDR